MFCLAEIAEEGYLIAGRIYVTPLCDILPPLKRVGFQLFLAITFVAEVRFAGSSVLAHPVAA